MSRPDTLVWLGEHEFRLGWRDWVAMMTAGRRTRARTVPFESGVSTGSLPRQRFSVSFYLTAMLSIVFDIEIVFLYPLAVQLHSLGWFGFAELAFFIVILLVAYVYIWRKGALNW